MAFNPPECHCFLFHLLPTESVKPKKSKVLVDLHNGLRGFIFVVHSSYGLPYNARRTNLFTGNPGIISTIQSQKPPVRVVIRKPNS
jgi:hypothetical protein